MPSNVLFLCTGNYYRSRFAEVLFNHLAKERRLGWHAGSRGLKIGWPGNVGPISPHTREKLGAMQIQVFDAERMPMLCCENDLAAADLVVALKEAEHREMLAAGFPGWEDRVTYWHVHDVDQAAPAKALAEIERLVRGLVKQLAAAEKAGQR